MNCTFQISTGKLIESQSDAGEATMRQNAAAAGYMDADVRFQVLTSSEFKAVMGVKAVRPTSLAPNAISGFLQVPVCAGTPTGVPVLFQGSAPIVYDKSAKKLWIYDDGWRSCTMT